MTYSPPQQAEHIRHQQLTPESPRPQQVPSPANIPILSLDKQMDPIFAESAYNSQHATPAPQYPSAASHTLNPPASTASQSQSQSQYAHQSHMSGFHEGGGPGQSAGSGAYGGAVGTQMQTQTQDTSSIQNYAAPHHTGAPAPHDAQPQTLPYHTAYPAQPVPFQSDQPAHYQTEAAAAGNVDVQALLDSLTPSAIHAPPGNYASQMSASQMSAQSAQPQGSASASLPQPTSNLPRRPPAQEKPVTHPNYDPSDDIRSYHPGTQMPSNTPQRAGQSQPGGQQPSPTGAHMSSAPGAGQSQPPRSTSPGDDEDIRWGPETNRLYEAFLDQERKFVTEGQWDQFPMGSRLFIGEHHRTCLNTSSDTLQAISPPRRSRNVTSSTDSTDTVGLHRSRSSKHMDSFNSWTPSRAGVHWTQSRARQSVAGRCVSMEDSQRRLVLTTADLEISKPQRNTKKAEPPANNGVRRRSRSPDYNRGGTGPSRDVRYNGPQSSMSPRDRDRRFRDRDDYRPMRSPSPRGPPRGMRSRDRSRDRYDGRYRSRSRTPPRRYRSPSPRRDPDDDLALPRRAPQEVPDIQVLVLNEAIPRLVP
jgi:hypothetical protein